MAAKLIKMFKIGQHVTRDGRVLSFTEADLRATAAVYNPDLHAAPLVIGHPKIDDPKYGHIEAVSFADGFLMGTPAKVDPEFAEIVNAGKYDRVSTSFYAPDSPSNPVPGVLYPRHLGFLGAAFPGCKGLGAVSFSDGEEGLLEYGDEKDKTTSFGDYEDILVIRTFRNLKNFLIEKFGQADAEKVIDEYTMDILTADATRDEPTPGTCSACGMSCSECTCTSSQSTTDFGDHMSKGGAMALTAQQIAEKEIDLTRRETALKTQENDKKHTDNISFAEGLVKEGKCLAANKAAVIAVLDFAAGVSSGDVIEFGEGEARKSQAPLEIVKAVFGSYPKLIEFGELAAGDENPGKKTEPIPGDIAKFI